MICKKKGGFRAWRVKSQFAVKRWGFDTRPLGLSIGRWIWWGKYWVFWEIIGLFGLLSGGVLASIGVIYVFVIVIG